MTHLSENEEHTTQLSERSSALVQTSGGDRASSSSSMKFDRAIKALIDPNGPKMALLTLSLGYALTRASIECGDPWAKSELLTLRDKTIEVITSDNSIVRHVTEGADRGYPGPPVKVIADDATFGRTCLDGTGDPWWYPETERTRDPKVDFSECEISVDMTWEEHGQAISAAYPAWRTATGEWIVGEPSKLEN